MKHSLLIACLLSLSSGLAFCQTRTEVDSLQHELAIAKDDTGRINAQIQLCLLYRLGNTDTSLMYGQLALESATNIGFVRGQISVLGFMCIVMEQRGNLPKSLELGFKALQLGEEHGLKILTGAALNGIGEAYIILKDYPTAITYLRRYIPIEQNSPNLQGLAYCYFDIGVAFTGLNQLDSANIYELKAIETFRKFNYEEPLVYQVLGDIKMQSGSHSEALDYYRKSLVVSLSKNESRALAYAYNKMASFYKKTNQPDSAIYYAQKGLAESRSINQKKTILEASALLSELYEPKDTKLSLQYLEIADAYKDSLFGAGTIEAVQSLVAREQDRQKEMRAAKIAFQNQLKEYALVGGLFILIVIAFFLYRNNQKEKNAKRLLQQKNEVIEQTLNRLKATQAQLIQSEKMASLGELTTGIAHEIQNPLNFVNNFSEVSHELIDEMKSELAVGNKQSAMDIAGDVQQNLEKIVHHGKRADAIVKGMLQHSRTSSGQKEPTDINALADEYLRLAYHGFCAKDKSFDAKFETDLDQTIGKVNIVPQDIGRVLLNLINNAFYAVAEKKQQLDGTYDPIVSVITRRKEDKIEVKVNDNGNGIPQKVLDKIFQPFFTTKPTGVGTGLGLSLSYDIVKAHGGEIKVQTKQGEGSEFEIYLPIL
jgi:signal transduction histidine kinase